MKSYFNQLDLSWVTYYGSYFIDMDQEFLSQDIMLMKAF